MTARRFALSLTAAAGGLLATTFLGSALAHADEPTDVALAASSSAADPNLPIWSIQDGVTAPTVLSESLQLPFYQSVVEQGAFNVLQTFPGGFFDGYSVNGTLDYTNTFGITDEELTFFGLGYNAVQPSVLDIMNLGNGYENIYADIASTSGANQLTDTVVTPFGDFEIPVSFDATAAPAAAADSTTLVEPGDFFADIVSAVQADYAMGQTEFSSAMAEFNNGDAGAGLAAFFAGVDDDTVAAQNNVLLGTIEALTGNDITTAPLAGTLPDPTTFADAVTGIQAYYAELPGLVTGLNGDVFASDLYLLFAEPPALLAVTVDDLIVAAVNSL